MDEKNGLKSGLWVKIMKVLAILWLDAIQLNFDDKPFFLLTLSRTDFIV